LGWNDRSLANQYYTSLKEFVKDKLTRIDRPIILLEIIKETIKINNYFLERSLEKKSSYNFRRKHNSSRRKYKNPIELDTMHKPQFSKEKQDKERQKELYYKYSLLEHWAASYKQKKKKGILEETQY
jgi:hypothetical protein